MEAERRKGVDCRLCLAEPYVARTPLVTDPRPLPTRVWPPDEPPRYEPLGADDELREDELAVPELREPELLEP